MKPLSFCPPLFLFPKGSFKLILGHGAERQKKGRQFHCSFRDLPSLGSGKIANKFILINICQFQNERQSFNPTNQTVNNIKNQKQFICIPSIELPFSPPTPTPRQASIKVPYNLYCLFLGLIMSIKQTQRIARSILHSLDDSLWESLARKAISKMPKYQLASESNRVLHDFVLMNGINLQAFSRELEEEKDKMQPECDSLQIGCIREVPRMRTYTQIYESDSSEIRKEEQNFRIKTTMQSLGQDQVKGLKTSPPEQSLNCTKLFLSELLNEEEQIYENQLRKSKLDNARYNQRIEALSRERQANSGQHSQSQKKKIRQLKAFTYDYQGKLLSTKIKNNGNLKFVNIKSKFNQSLGGKEHRTLLERIQKTKYSEIVEKKVINFDESEVREPIASPKVNRNAVGNYNNSLNDLFKTDQCLEMGVSITDMVNNSKLMGNNKSKAKNSMKLSDFKKSFKSSTVIQRKPHPPYPHSDKKPQIQQNSIRMRTVSDVESKFISSAFSKHSQGTSKIGKIGKISIVNEKAFMQSFYNDEL